MLEGYFVHRQELDFSVGSAITVQPTENENEGLSKSEDKIDYERLAELTRDSRYSLVAANREGRTDQACEGTRAKRHIENEGPEPKDSDGRRDRKEAVQSNERLAELLDGMGFCEPTHIIGTHGPILDQVKTAILKVSPGPSDGGYANPWTSRISFSYRYDLGHGATAIVPVGLAIPGLGGWLVGRVAATRDVVRHGDRFSADVLYTPSASRFADWYVAAGTEKPTESPGWRPAEEIGLRFRFNPLKKLGLLGARVGVRTNGAAPIQNTRLIFEVGGGVW